MTGFVNPLKPRTGSGYADALARIREWTRDSIPPGDPVISITELACVEPGCPPQETVILIMWTDAPAWKLRVHKRMPDVTFEDVVLSLRSAERIERSGS